jgi:hypothetical protein
VFVSFLISVLVRVKVFQSLPNKEGKSRMIRCVWLKVIGLGLGLDIKGKVVGLAHTRRRTGRGWPYSTFHRTRGEESSQAKKSPPPHPLSNNQPCQAYYHSAFIALTTMLPTFLLPSSPLTLHQPHHQGRVSPSMVEARPIQLGPIKHNDAT